MFFPAFFLALLALLCGGLWLSPLYNFFVFVLIGSLVAAGSFFFRDNAVYRSSLLLGLLSAFLVYLLVHQPYRLNANEEVNIEGEFTATIEEYNSYSAFMQTRTEQKDFLGRRLYLRFQIDNFKKHSDKRVQIGQHWQLQCEFHKISVKNSFQKLSWWRNYRHTCKPTSIKLTTQVVWAEQRQQWHSWINAKLSRLDNTSLAKGFVLSDSSSLHPPLLDLYRKMGIAHLFAASGLHVGLLFFTVSLPFMLLRLPKVGLWIGVLSALFFLVLLDFKISLLRAFLFVITYAVLKTMDRRTHSLITLFFAAAVIEIIFPFSSFSVGFILSFVVTFFIIAFYKMFFQLYKMRINFIRSQIAITLCAFFGSAALSFLFFDYFNPLSLILNFLLVPLAGIYLTTSIAYLFFEPAKFILQFFDTLFLYSARFSWQFVLQYFQIYSVYIVCYLSLLYSMLVVLYVYYIKNRLALLRKFQYLFVAIILVSFAPILFFKKNFTKTKIIPYAVLQVDQDHLYFYGKPEKFIDVEQRPLIEKSVTQNSNIKKVFADEPFHQNVKKFYLRKWEVPIPHEPISITLKEDFITDKQNNCFFFSAKLNITSLKKIQGCNTIFLALSKKQRQDEDQKKQWQELFRLMGYKKEIRLVGYFEWF